MKKSLLIVATALSATLSAQTKADYIFFKGDTLVGFDINGAINEATSKLSMPKEQKVYVYRKELAFVRSKYNLPTPTVKSLNISTERNSGTNSVSSTGCNNLDFSAGSFMFWNGAIGYNTKSDSSLSISSYGIPSSGINAAETSCSFFTLLSSQAGVTNDPYGSFQIIAPGSNYSVRLGGENINTGGGGPTGTCPSEDQSGNAYSNGEILQNSFSVTPQNDLITYHYAVVLDDAPHAAGEQPYYSIQVLDGTGAVIPAFTSYFTSNAGAPPTGFIISPTANASTLDQVSYLPWTTGTFNLSNYVGSIVTIKVTASGCIYGGHSAYGYFDATCGAAGILPTNPVICSNTPVVLTSPAAVTYTWTGSGIVGATNTQTVEVNAVGTYTLSYTDYTSAIFTYTTAVTAASNPTVTISGAHSLCAGTPDTLYANGATWYNWGATAGGVVSNSVIVTPTVTTVYAVAGYTGSCSSVASVTVNVVAAPSLVVTASSYTICNGSSQNLSANGAGTYTWSPVASLSNANIPNPIANPTTTTVYTVTGTATGCGPSAPVTVTVVVNNSKTATINPVGCNSVTVNAITYTATGTYTQSFTNSIGCDSILTINATIKKPTTATISPVGCNSVMVNAITYTATGTYTQSFTNAAGCDSTLTIKANIGVPTTATINPVGCSNVTVNATTYTAAGTYTQNLTTITGCDSTLTINVTLNNSSTTATINPVGCNSVTVNATTYTATGTYTQSLTTTTGCDSTLTINVTINNLPTTATISPIGCNSVTVNATTYAATGTYTQNLTNVHGCDSTLTINATVNYPTTATISPISCNSVTVNATTYTATGTYTQNLTNAHGCDSTLTINATIKLPTTATVSPIGCNSVMVNATTYTATGTYTQHFTNAAGCDSTLTINASIKKPTTATISPVSCNSVIVNATTYTATGTYTQHFTNAAGCDSTLSIIATINSLPTISISVSSATVCAGISTTLTANGALSYTWANTGAINASITTTLNATTQYTVTGTDNNNCMNSDTLSIMVENCTTGFSQKSALNTNISIYPNPAMDILNVDGLPLNGNYTLIITDMLGNSLYNSTYTTQHNTINLSDLSNGMYMIKVLKDSTIVHQSKIVKQD